jgi:hypothetical protein
MLALAGCVREHEHLPMTRFFTLKAWLTGVGALVGLGGIAVGWRWPVWVAVGLLGGAFLLRFAEREGRAS